jgi:hypothetical protein
LLGYFLFEMPSNLLLYRFGARRWIAWIMVSRDIVSTAMAGWLPAQHVGPPMVTLLILCAAAWGIHAALPVF